MKNKNKIGILNDVSNFDRNLMDIDFVNDSDDLDLNLDCFLVCDFLCDICNDFLCKDHTSSCDDGNK